MMFAGTTHAPVRTACRGDAVRRPGAVVHDGNASSPVPAHHGPAGRPTGSPLHCLPVGLVERADRTLPAVSNEATKRRLSLAGRGRRGAPGEGRSSRCAPSEGPRRLSSRPLSGSGGSILGPDATWRLVGAVREPPPRRDECADLGLCACISTSIGLDRRKRLGKKIRRPRAKCTAREEPTMQATEASRTRCRWQRGVYPRPSATRPALFLGPGTVPTRAQYCCQHSARERSPFHLPARVHSEFF
jgi:hypothetical protein